MPKIAGVDLTDRQRATLKTARTKAKLTLKELASILDISHPQISMLESGATRDGRARRPSEDLLKRWASALGYRATIPEPRATLTPKKKRR